MVAEGLALGPRKPRWVLDTTPDNPDFEAMQYCCWQGKLTVVLLQSSGFTAVIPQNTGNIARTCAATGVGLHLVGPLGFEIDDRR